MRDNPAAILVTAPNGSGQPQPESLLAVEVRDLTVAYDGAPVLYDVDMDIPRGTIVGVVGPNGAGKTTLLRALLGLVKPAAGSIRILGQSISNARGSIAYVPQRASVDWDFPATILDVALMGTYGRLGWFRRPGRQEKADALEALQRVGLESLANRPIGELSGGQQQRAFVARALVQKAPLVLMDEPFAGVDAVTEQAIVELLRQMRADGTTIIVVHHDLHSVHEYFDWVVLLNRRAVAVGPVATEYNEVNLRAAFGGRVGALGRIVFGSGEAARDAIAGQP